MALTGKAKSFLRSQAHDLQPVVQIGKNNVTDSIINTTLKALEAHELIKISVLQNCFVDPKDVAISIAKQTDSDIVQVIGRIIVLYKRSSLPANRIVTNRLPK